MILLGSKTPSNMPFFPSSIIIDPTVLNTRKRLSTFLESVIYNDYLTVLPSFISSLIQREKWDKLVNLLREWEWNLDRTESEEWFSSADFKHFCRQLDKVSVSFDKVMEELSSEEKELSSKILKFFRHDSPQVVRLAKELITVAIIKKGGIISFSRHLRKWLKSLRRVLILEISEKTNVLSAIKAEIKSRLSHAGWRGRVFITILNITTALALAKVFPMISDWTINTILTELGEEVIVGIITNGH